jgi:hypothetical protein
MVAITISPLVVIPAKAGIHRAVRTWFREFSAIAASS